MAFGLPCQHAYKGTSSIYIQRVKGHATHRNGNVDGEGVAKETDQLQEGVALRVATPPKQSKQQQGHHPPVAEDGCGCKRHCQTNCPCYICKSRVHGYT